MSQRSLREATITLNDAGSNSVTVVIGTGNITWTEKRPVEFVLDRGTLTGDGATVRLADDEPMDVSLDFVWEWLLDTVANTTPYEALTQSGSAASWVSTNDACEPYAVDIKIKFDACGGSSETITLKRFMYESIGPNVKDGQISVSGRCFALSPSDDSYISVSIA